MLAKGVDWGIMLLAGFHALRARFDVAQESGTQARA
jgi:hypothetical protein